MIAIPNMEKPKNCYQCSFNGGIFCDLIDNGTDAFIKDNPTEVATKVLPDCPLIEIVKCGECKHRDPEDKKCDCGMFERQGCIFPVADDYFCKYGERRSE